MTFDFGITPAQVPSIAPHIDFVWGGDSDKVSAWHAANAKIYVSYYMPFDQDPSVPPLSLKWWQDNHPDWVLYQCDRTTVAKAVGYDNIDLDVANPEVQAWQLDIVKSVVSQGYDGVAFDLFAIDNAHGACGIVKDGQWVQRYTGDFSDPQYTADVIPWLQSMYAALHALPKPMGVIPNYSLARTADDPLTTQIIANVDAVLDEAMVGNYGQYVTDSDWVQRIAFMESLQANGKAFYAINGYTPLDEGDVQWSLASCLMGKEQHASIYVAESDGAQYGVDAWRSEYAAAIGPACGPMTTMQGAYVRSFAHGLAIANPSSTTSVQFSLPSTTTYTDLSGNPLSGTVTLNIHSGIVLLVVGASNC